MGDFSVPPRRKRTDSCVDEEGHANWVQVEFGGRIYLVPRS